MPSDKPIGSCDGQSTRRRFLRTSGSALALAWGGGAAFPAEGSEATSTSAPCGFSQLPPDFVYLNNGTEGSMPSCVLSALQDGLGKWAGDPTSSYESDPVFGKRQELNRNGASRFLGVGTNNICLTDNTTMGLSMTLMGLNFQPGDRVVITNHEHPAVRSPLRQLQARSGLRVETRSFPPAERLRGFESSELLDTLFPKSDALMGARALCVSHVYPTTGVRLPLSSLRKKADELDIEYLIVDGAQALGVVDLSAAGEGIENCDFYAAPGHKWLNGPPSTGLLYIRDSEIAPPDFYPTLSQRMERYSDGAEGSSPPFPMAEALQIRGCSNAPGFAAMIRAMEFAEDSGGAQQIEVHILGLSREVKDFILSRAPHGIVSPHADPALLSGLTVFHPFLWDRPETVFTDKDTADRVVAELRKRNVQIRAIGFRDERGAGMESEVSYAVRVSTGHFNTAGQVEIFKGALEEVLSRLG